MRKAYCTFSKFLCTLLISFGIIPITAYAMNASENINQVSDISSEQAISASEEQTTATTEVTTTTTATTLKATTSLSKTSMVTTTTVTTTTTIKETEAPTETRQTSTETYLGTYEATWYCATDMGYSSPPYGASGRTLQSGYSIASNSIPSGTLVKITGGGIDGIYRVDDRGGMSNNVIDVYYWDRSCVPYSFLNSGRISVEVYLVG